MRPRLWPERPSAVADVALVVAVAVVALPLHLTGLDGQQPPGPWRYLLGELPFVLLLLLRRSVPVAVLAVCTAVPMVAWLVSTAVPDRGPPMHALEYLPLAAAVAVYSALVHSPRRVDVLGLIGVLVLFATSPWELVRGSPDAVDAATGGLLLTVGPALLGLYVGVRRRLLSSLAERAERDERENLLVAADAHAAERAQLAAEMHDVVTHRVSLIVLQAGALRITAVDDGTRRVAEELRTAGCQALEELRDLVGVLRADSCEDADAEDGSERASLPDLAGLVDASRSAGVPVELVEAGDPLVASPVVGRTAYRIVREALTNVHKHAPGAPTRVEMRYTPDGVGLTVRNAVPSRHRDGGRTAGRSGSGLELLRRRVELVHGALRAGPCADGGFRVEALLPTYVPTSNSTRQEHVMGARDGG